MLADTLKEIREIPKAALSCFEKNKKVCLPEKVVYLGMGASFTPLLALQYAGARIYPYLASEYYHYLSRGEKMPQGVLISQSGKSSEALWCRALFDRYIAITNDPKSPLAIGKNVEEVIDLHAGDETSISSKTYINTLTVLYQGLGFNVEKVLEILSANFQKYEIWGREQADKIHSFLEKIPYRGFYIIGSGPNYASAKQGALVMSEATKLGVIGMSLAQYDHGPKETAANSAVIIINVKGKEKSRADKIFGKIRAVNNCLPISLSIEGVEEIFSPITTIVPINFLTYYLAKNMGITSVYQLGGKVVEA